MIVAVFIDEYIVVFIPLYFQYKSYKYSAVEIVEYLLCNVRFYYDRRTAKSNRFDFRR